MTEQGLTLDFNRITERPTSRGLIGAKGGERGRSPKGSKKSGGKGKEEEFQAVSEHVLVAGPRAT